MTTPPPAPFGDDPRATAAAAKAYAKAQRPWYRKKRFLLPLAFVVVIAIAMAAGGGDDGDGDVATGSSTDADGGKGAGSSEDADEGAGIPKSDFSTNTENPPGADVELAGCSVEFGMVTANLRVVNNSSKPSDYFITLGFTDETGAKVGDGLASTSNVAPGQVANIDGVGTVSDAAVGEVTCVIEEVERFAS